MSSRAALSSEASSPRMLVLDGETAHDVFDVLGVSSNVVRVRSAFLFEVGEELTLRVELDGAASEAVARVRGHVGPDDAPITELELLDGSETRGASE